VEPSTAAEYAEYRGMLWVPRDVVCWRHMDRGLRAELLIGGGPDGASGRVIIMAGEHPWPDGSISILWRDERMDGLDLGGSAHKDTRGRKIPTPHRQWFDARGREHTTAVDLQTAGVSTLEQAVRWLVVQSAIEWHAIWQDPPVQPPLPLTPGRGRRRRRKGG
jgi:hypothetical protein